MKNVNSDVAYNYLRQRILDGTFASGDALTASTLAGEIGLSRTPVREALRQLETEGLVEIRPHLGATVRKLEFKDFKEMCGMRLALESYAAELAAKNATEIDLQEIGAALMAMRQLTAEIVAKGENEARRAGLIREDIRFHVAILTAAQNDLIKKSILQLHLVNRIVSAKVAMTEPKGQAESASNRREVLQEHEAIHDGIAERDEDAARRAMRRHILQIVDKQIALRARATANATAKPLSNEELLYTP